MPEYGFSLTRILLCKDRMVDHVVKHGNKNWTYAGPMSEYVRANPTKFSSTLKQYIGKADKLFECGWPFCGIGA